MSLVYAKIEMLSEPGMVVNTQVIEEGDILDPAFTWVDITEAAPVPGRGWSYEDGVFTPPALPPSPPDEDPE